MGQLIVPGKPAQTVQPKEGGGVQIRMQLIDPNQGQSQGINARTITENQCTIIQVLIQGIQTLTDLANQLGQFTGNNFAEMDDRFAAIEAKLGIVRPDPPPVEVPAEVVAELDMKRKAKKAPAPAAPNGPSADPDSI